MSNDSPSEPATADQTALEAAAFRRLVEHLRLRDDVTNIQLMGVAGFCRNCLADWLEEASVEAGRPITTGEARTMVYGEPYADWKARQPEATEEELAAMKASQEETARRRAARGEPILEDRLDKELAETFPASDTPKVVR